MASSEVKTGFYLGLGLLLAVAAWTLLSLFLSRVVRRHG
jgi:hypothetical protein